MNTNNRIESIAPVNPTARIFHLLSYVMMLWASLIVIQGFVLGQALLPPQGTLTFFQGIFVVLLSSMIMAVFMSLNGVVGLQLGVPFCIQARGSFGIRGARIAEVMRLVPALVWFGFGTWIAALAMDGIVQTLTGFTAPGIRFLYFIALQTIQSWFAYRGVKAMKWFSVGASVALVLIMGQILYQALQSERFHLEQDWYAMDNWGWAFWMGVNATVGILVTVMVSASDLTRYLENRKSSMWWGHFLGIIPPLLFMMFLGFVSSITTGEWDPIQALMQLSSNPILMVLMLFFVLVAQFSTNFTVNILPPALIFEELLGIDWKKSIILVGVLGSLTFPWILLENGTKFINFINYYTAFFGPLLGCMLAQRWLERNPVSMDDLYNTDATSRYWYSGGYNLTAIITTALVSVYVMTWHLEISWLVGMPLSLVVYVIIHRLSMLFST